MARIEVKWYGDKFKGDINKQVRRKMERAGIRLTRRIKLKLSGGRRPVGELLTPGAPPHVDTGRLRNSIFHEVAEDGMSVIVGTTLLYGLYLELGAHIEAKNVKYLTIPATEQARKFGQTGKSARDYPIHLSFVPLGGDLAMLIDSKTDTVHFWLKKSVTLPPHPYIVPSLHEFEDELETIFSEPA